MNTMATNSAIPRRLSAARRALSAGPGRVAVMLLVMLMLLLVVFSGLAAEAFPEQFSYHYLNGSNGFRVDGENAGDRSGRSVSHIGDINGDGIGDLVIGAHLASPNDVSAAGRVYVVFGRDGDFPASVDLATLDGSNGFRLNGVAAGDHAGQSVGAAGDINGDGIDDLVIGANLADPNGNSRAGSSYVVFGRDTGFPAVMDLAELDGANGFRLDGEATLDGSGTSVSRAGDVNGDGIDDLVIGASGSDHAGNGAGSAYVVFGSSAFSATMSLAALNGSNGFRMDGAAAGERAGNSVSAAGDVNGDGVDDLIIGAFRANDDAGSAFVVFGRETPFLATLSLGSLNGVNGFRIDGVSMGDFAGRSVAGAGDIDGDGLDDLIIGADRADPGGREDAGSVYIVFGRASSFPAVLGLGSLNGENGFRLDGIVAGDRTGSTVSTAGDINHDGLSDLIVGNGAYGGPSASRNGLSFVVFGDTAGFPAQMNLSALDGSNGFRLLDWSAEPFDGLPQHVAGGGDLNGDGIDDLIVGSEFSEPNDKNLAGSSFVFFGRDALAQPFPSVLELGGLGGSSGTIFDGVIDGWRAGYSVSGAGDFNGDGRDDLLIGAQGRCFLIYGREAPLSSPFPLNDFGAVNGLYLIGEGPVENRGNFGNSVSAAGDFNGDGFDDVIVGAYRLSANGFDSGRSYLLFGTDQGLPASLEVSDLDGSNGFAIDGEAAYDRSGFSVSGAGDVNADGFDDVLISAPGADPNGSASGRAYLLYGSDQEWPNPFDLSSLDGENGVALNGESEADWFSYSASAAGDVNGDGFDDIVIGAWRAEPNGQWSGRAYVVFGSASGLEHPFEVQQIDGANGFALDGEEAGALAGRSVAGAGDVNDDGVDDLVIGAPGSDLGGELSGRTYVVFGSRNGFPHPLSLSTIDLDSGWVLDGREGDWSGAAVSKAGDINGDGIDDVLIGAPSADPNGSNSGVAYVVYGSRQGLVAPLALPELDGQNGFVLNGARSGFASGFAVGPTGDFNRDGLDDLVIGAYGADPEYPTTGPEEVGRAYLLLGRSNTIFSDRFESDAP